MKIIIAGSRNIIDYDKIKKIIDSIVEKNNIQITEVISGCALGIDTIAINWAWNKNISVKKFPADWNKYGKKAGYLRNEEMSKYADGLIAIWDGSSKGTEHMIKIMKKLNKLVIVELI